MFYFSKLTKKMHIGTYYMALFRIRPDTFFSTPAGAALMGRECGCVFTAAVVS